MPGGDLEAEELSVGTLGSVKVLDGDVQTVGYRLTELSHRPGIGGDLQVPRDVQLLARLNVAVSPAVVLGMADGVPAGQRAAALALGLLTPPVRDLLLTLRVHPSYRLSACHAHSRHECPRTPCGVMGLRSRRAAFCRPCMDVALRVSDPGAALARGPRICMLAT